MNTLTTSNATPPKRSLLARKAGILLAVAAMLSPLVTPLTAQADSKGKGRDNPLVYPPTAKVHGKSLTDWLLTYWRWSLTGADPAESLVNGVQLLPIPAEEQISGSGTAEDPALLRGLIQLNLPEGTPFVLPASAWTQERFNDGRPDELPFAEDLYLEGISPTLTIDGRVVLSDANEAAFHIPPTPFDPVVLYDEPTSYGSIGVVAIQTVGVVVKPLSKGKHTVHLYEPYIIPGFSFGIIYDNTWEITVTGKECDVEARNQGRSGHRH